MTLPYFVGGEDSEFTPVQLAGACAIDTTAGTFRSGIPRLSLSCDWGNSADTVGFWRSSLAYSTASGWWSVWCYIPVYGTGAQGGGTPFRWSDANGITRIQIVNVSGGSLTGNYQLEKVNAVGTRTVLTTFSMSPAFTTLQKFDVNIVYATSGSIAIYLNGSLITSYLGDVTTDGNTTLNSHDLGTFNFKFTNISSFASTRWSESVVHPNSTLNMSLSTGVPTANGVTTQMSGAVSDINESTVSNQTVNTSLIANQIQEYTSSAISSSLNSHTVRSVTMSGLTLHGSSGPQHYNWLLGFSGTDYFSITQREAAHITYGSSQDHWDINPATGITFQQSEIGNAAGFNIGLKSAA